MGDNKGEIKDKNQNDVKGNKEELKLETRTIEELLKDLRQEKRWSYLQLMEELQRNGVTVNDKEIKKWEYGLEYPSLDVIYKLSGIYKISSQKLIEAKNNSFQKGLNSIAFQQGFIHGHGFLPASSDRVAPQHQLRQRGQIADDICETCLLYTSRCV